MTEILSKSCKVGADVPDECGDFSCECGFLSFVFFQVFGFIATFLMAVNLWTSYSVACGPQAGMYPANRPHIFILNFSSFIFTFASLQIELRLQVIRIRG